MPYCIYLRKSRADYEAEQHGEGETLARHRAVLTKLAARNHHPIGHVYQEIVSGETIADRPQVQALLRDVAAGKWTGVYVAEVERLARGDTMDQGLIAHAFKSAGTYIITPTKTYNPADPSDEEYFEFSLFMSRREYKTINRRMQGGRLQSVREGKFIGSRPPYGYRKVKLPNDKGYTLAIDEAEAQVVRQIYSWYLNGIDGQAAGLVRIAGRLQDLHVPAGDGGYDWRPCRVHRILTNPTYCGLIPWGKCKTVRDVTPAGVVKHREMSDDGELYQGLHPAIIDDDTFAAVQNRRVTPRKHIPIRKGASLSNPLAGLVYCSECGHAMSGLPAGGHNQARIKCRTRGCPTVQNNLRPVEEAILATLREWLERAEAAIITPPDAPAPEEDITASAILAMRGERAKITRQIDKLHDLVEQEVYTIDQYNSRYVTLQERLNTLDSDIAAAQREAASRQVYCTPVELRPAIIRLLAEYDGATAEQKNVMLKACISRAVYRKHNRGLIIKGIEYANPDQFELDIYPTIKM